MQTNLSGGQDGRGDPGAQRTPSPLMFWVLAGLAAVAFVPCVVLPAWRDYEALVLADALAQQRVDALREDVEVQQRRLEAIRTDPAVATRLAQRELAYVLPGETSIRLVGVQVGAIEPPDSPVERPQPPIRLDRFVQHLPAADYDRVFCEQPTRSVVLLLSGGVMAAAICLGPPRKTP